ncbi:MAG TPA: ankyrin repeat domain-containing protein [Polyangia bacterium]|nr:ankyrin repeat domain-containing protein [Polyangia bacterium]
MIDALLDAAAAAGAGDLPRLQRLLRATPALLRARAADGDTLLGLACRAATGDVAIPPVAGTPAQHAAVDLLLAAGADPSAATADGWAPLHTAAMAGHDDLARRLLAAGASRAGRLWGTQGGSPLALALFYARTGTAALLATPAIPDNLRTAAALGRPLDRFVDGVGRGARLTAAAADGCDFYRPLALFPLWERTFSRQELLDEALTWAARNDQVAAMAALVQMGADLNANPYRGTALLWAIYDDRVAAATWLLDNGADPNLRHDFGGAQHGRAATALHLAAQHGGLRCLRLLLARGAEPTIRDGAYNATPLGWAEHAGSTEAAAILRAAR